MTTGRSIRLFLVDGTPSGLLTAEIVNWTGHVLMGPRSKLSELIRRPECNRTGIYFLIGPSLDASLRPLVYIGETDDVATRLKQHNRPEHKDSTNSGKDFWERVCLVTSKDENLTKAHVKYLESLLIQIATETGRCTLVNGTAHRYSSLPESDRADMSFFIDQIRIVLPALGLDFLRERPSLVTQSVQQASIVHDNLPRFVLELPKYEIKAEAQEIDGEFVVLADSLARADWGGSEHSYQYLHRQLCEDGVLLPAQAGLRRFADAYVFSSPSAAAAVITGRTANGRRDWKVKGTGQLYADWQDQQVNAATVAAVEEGGVEPSSADSLD